MESVLYKNILKILFLIISINTMAQDERAQLPLVLRNAYFGVSVGSINYDFGAMPFNAPAGYILDLSSFRTVAWRLP